MPRFLLLFLFFFCSAYGQEQVSICSWNIQNFGKSKSDKEIGFIARTINRFDIVALQEVVSGPEGPKAVAKLLDALSRKGFKWDYAVSPVVSSDNPYQRERYAFLWKPSRVKTPGKAFLDRFYAAQIEREPYLLTFQRGQSQFTLANYHAPPKNKNPEAEIKYFKSYPDLYKSHNMIFCGDFNLPESHSVFNPLKKIGYAPALVGQKTTLRQKCLADGCLASQYDNFFFEGKSVVVAVAGVVHFYRHFSAIKKAREISDHLPVYIVLDKK